MLNLEENLFKLSIDLKNKSWTPDPYHAFYVKDPKLRHIHKASVRDRVLYQAVYRKLYYVFDPHFIYDSYSCRNDKGLHKGSNRLKDFIRKSTRNYTITAFALKCDIRKFFDSIDHKILFSLISKKVKDQDLLWLIKEILNSFSKTEDIGLPLGNVTSQLFSNIYLNELDQFIKHGLKIKYYARYCDDFVIVENDVNKIASYIKEINLFLRMKLNLRLHPNKVIVRKCTQGIDFLGYILKPNHTLVRTKTKNRIFKKISKLASDQNNKGKLLQTLPSYLGILDHAHSNKLKDKLVDTIAPSFKDEIDQYKKYSRTILLIFKYYKTDAKQCISPHTYETVNSVSTCDNLTNSEEQKDSLVLGEE